jgi:DNA polymerase-3 subunit alpha
VKPFVHLRVHSDYSMVDGLLRVHEVVEAARDKQMAAVALTDQNNFCGLIKFYRKALSQGVKPIVGVDVWVHAEAMGDEPFRMVLLCRNRKGYENLTELVTRSYREGQGRGFPVIECDWFVDHTEGVLALSGGVEGDVGRALLAGKMSLAAERLGLWKHRFPDAYYLELERTGRPFEDQYIEQAIRLAEGSKTPVVATNNVRFREREDFEAHEARVCIHEGRVLEDAKRPRNYTPQQYFKSAEEMHELFADIPEALENTVRIAQRCNLELELGTYHLPEFPIPEGQTLESYFREEARRGLEKRLKQLLDREQPDYAERRKRYEERLETELDVIISMGFPGYFLIVADFIQWSKDNGIPVGPGRGSGAGSLVAYALRITDLDPLAYDLLFERFLNPERVSMPDFDVDFCMEGRDRVIDYVAEKYGRDAVSQIITFGTMAAKAVVRDAGRVLGKPYGLCDRVSKMIPFDLGITLDKAFEQEEAIRQAYEEDPDVREIWDLGRKLEGLIRGSGKHAGGVVIAPTKLTDFTPLLCDEAGQNLVTQFDKDDVEAAGLVKFDFLGLRTLTIIDWAVKALNKERQREGLEPIDISAIPLDDAKTYGLLQRGDTTAVFQLESGGMKKLIRALKPSNFEDIVALVALYRPGPLGSGMDKDFVNRKHGRQKVVYPHPLLEPILRPTYGTILYQEQVMQIAQVMAGYSLGQADLLRRAMGKKKAEVMAEQRAVFVEGAGKQGIDEATASHVFDLMEEFAKYGFNKSHSAAYALVSYQTAWLKAHYPAHFMAAVMSSDMDNTDKVVTYVDDALSLGIRVEPPDINRGGYMFTAVGPKTIVYGIGAIKGVGRAAIDSIVHEREANGPYRDLFDFCLRVDLKKANRRVIEALIKAGALDCFGTHRASLMASLEEAIKAAEQKGRDEHVGQNDLFGGPSPSPQELPASARRVGAWPESHKLALEKETLGLYLTGHPFEQFREELGSLTAGPLKSLQPGRRGEEVTVAGLIVAVRTIKSKNGSRWALVTLDDRTGRLEVAVYADLYETRGSLLAKDKILVARGEVSNDDYTEGLKLVAKQVWDMTSIREERARCLLLEVDATKAPRDFSARLKQQLAPYVQGTTPISLQVQTEQAKAVIDFGPNWRVTPSEELLVRLEELLGKGRVRCVYP